MSKELQVGEIAVVIGYTEYPEFLGDEVEIVGGLGYYHSHSKKSGRRYFVHGYRVKRSNGYAIYRRQSLKRRPPPVVQREETGEWELCPWQPRSAVTV